MGVSCRSNTSCCYSLVRISTNISAITSAVIHSRVLDFPTSYFLSSSSHSIYYFHLIALSQLCIPHVYSLISLSSATQLRILLILTSTRTFSTLNYLSVSLAIADVLVVPTGCAALREFSLHRRAQCFSQSESSLRGNFETFQLLLANTSLSTSARQQKQHRRLVISLLGSWYSLGHSHPTLFARLELVHP